MSNLFEDSFVDAGSFLKVLTSSYSILAQYFYLQWFSYCIHVMSVYAKFPWRDKYSPSLLVCVLSCIGNCQLDLDIGKVFIELQVSCANMLQLYKVFHCAAYYFPGPCKFVDFYFRLVFVIKCRFMTFLMLEGQTRWLVSVFFWKHAFAYYCHLVLGVCSSSAYPSCFESVFVDW